MYIDLVEKVILKPGTFVDLIIIIIIIGQFYNYLKFSSIRYMISMYGFSFPWLVSHLFVFVRGFEERQQVLLK